MDEGTELFDGELIQESSEEDSDGEQIDVEGEEAADSGVSSTTPVLEVGDGDLAKIREVRDTVMKCVEASGHEMKPYYDRI